jgi:hypothetical protein
MLDHTIPQPLLDVSDLCRMFEESESASLTSRKDAERDRDYVDGKQLSSDELAELTRRGQPPVIDNRIKTKIDYLVGLEKQQRVKPKAFPRTPRHEADADAANTARKSKTARHRSGAVGSSSSLFLIHAIDAATLGACTHKSAVSALPTKADLRADAPRFPHRARFGPHNAQAQTAGLPPGSERHGVRSSCPAHALFRPGG